MIKLEQIAHRYTERPGDPLALRHIDLEIGKGTLNAIVGPSGSGKSTLMAVMGLILEPSQGKYRYEGREMTGLSRRERTRFRSGHFGFILQDFALIGDYTVRQNVEVPLLYYSRLNARERRREVDRVLEKLGISQLRDRNVRHISGGEKQRTAIARALVSAPEVIFADEPTGALDQENGQVVMDLLTEIWREGRTVIMVTHNEKLAARCQRVIRICDGQLMDKA